MRVEGVYEFVSVWCIVWCVYVYGVCGVCEWCVVCMGVWCEWSVYGCGVWLSGACVSTLQEQITFNEPSRGSSQISGLLR